MISLLIDRRVQYLQSNSSAVSLLTSPVGASSLLDHVAGRIADVVDGEMLIMPTFGSDRSYNRRIRESTSAAVRVIDADGLAGLLGECEPSDYLLVADPAQWPVNGCDLGQTILRLHEYRGASHAVAVGADIDEHARERVERDGNGQVKRVQRFYNGVSWPEAATTAILFSLVPARVVRDTCFTSLAGLRAALSGNGVLSRDVPVAWDVVDLTEEDGLLALNEQVLMKAIQRAPWPGFRMRQAGILVGRACEIHALSRLVGPVIIHDGVRVEAGVTIMGPTVVGSGSRIGCGATIAHSILASNSVVGTGSAVLHRVTSGCRSTSAVRADAPMDRVPAIRKPSGRRGEMEGSQAALEVQAVSGSRRVHLALKRAMDVVVSAVALVVMSPLLLLTAIMIKLDSRGPVLFVHRREQKGGKEFPCLKFRTMTCDAHKQQRELYEQNEVDGPQFNLPDDPRITRIGTWLRPTNVDELPQLINVLLGQMSLVGPRPSPFRENQICVPWRRARLSVRPGITGLWQICRSADRSHGDFHEWIHYDITYVRHLSIWLDIKILLATVLTLGGRRRVPLSRMVRDRRGGASRAPRRLSMGA